MGKGKKVTFVVLGVLNLVCHLYTSFVGLWITLFCINVHSHLSYPHPLLFPPDKEGGGSEQEKLRFKNRVEMVNGGAVIEKMNKNRMRRSFRSFYSSSVIMIVIIIIRKGSVRNYYCYYLGHIKWTRNKWAKNERKCIHSLLPL